MPYATSTGSEWQHSRWAPNPQGFDSWVWWDHFVDRPAGGGSVEVWRFQVRPWLLLIAPAILPALWARG